MLTDWILIARLAHELDERLRGARVTAAGRLADGRIALALGSKARSQTLAIDAFASPPLATLEPAAATPEAEPGFPRALNATLRAMTVRRVRARRGDRLIAIEFGARSRFGVDEEVALVIELVPRFGNAVVVKHGTVVAALKEFSPSQNGRRSVQAGMPYAFPPLPAGATDHPLAGLIEDGAAYSGPIHVYRREGRIVAAHVAPLPAHADADLRREPSLVAVLGKLREERLAGGERERVARRKAALVKRLDGRERKLRDEMLALDVKGARADARDELRDEGERIFATLHEHQEPERDDAKQRAAELFSQYKKLRAARPHIERRRAAVAALLEAVEALRWECERAGAADLDDVEAAVAHLEPRRGGAAAAPVRKRKRAPLEMRTEGGSRILVGRNPGENAELTFRVARPNDLWFHARGIPGAHVVLARDDRTPPSAADLEAAAALAAFHSKARASAKVSVDYTLRKYVRKQLDAPPGLVWYTHSKTIVARPSAAPASA